MSKPKLIIVSGHFNPVRLGHVKLLQAAKALGDELLVVVNNDRQQLLKKGSIFLDERERLEIVRSIRYVDDVFLSVDRDPTINQTLLKIVETYPEHEIIFGNGGDRRSVNHISELSVCMANDIKLVFNLGD